MVAIRPAISVGFDVPINYLAANQVDVSVIISAVQRAVQLSVNDAPLGAPVTLARLAAVVADVPGVLRCRYVDSDGPPLYSAVSGWSSEADLPASPGGYLVDVPAMINCADVVIRQA